MLFFGLCGTISHGVSFALFLLHFGRLTGIFALQSFVDHCHDEQEKSSTIPKNPCPPSIHINPLKSLYSNK